MIGASKKNRLFQWRFMYAFGSSTPMANTPMARTTRVNSSVMVLVVALSPFPQLLGSNILAPYGPVRHQPSRSETKLPGRTDDHAEEKCPTCFTNVQLTIQSTWTQFERRAGFLTFSRINKENMPNLEMAIRVCLCTPISSYLQKRQNPPTRHTRCEE